MVLKADENRVQAVRHRVGQLDSVKRMPFEELESMRVETAQRLKELEAKYWGQTENREVGKKIRDAYKKHGFTMDTIRNADEVLEAELAAAESKKKKNRSKSRKQGETDGHNSTIGGPGSLAKKKDKKDRHFEGGKKGTADMRESEAEDAADVRQSRSRSRKDKSKSKHRVLSPEEAGLQYANPRQ